MTKKEKINEIVETILRDEEHLDGASEIEIEISGLCEDVVNVDVKITNECDGESVKTSTPVGSDGESVKTSTPVEKGGDDTDDIKKIESDIAKKMMVTHMDVLMTLFLSNIKAFYDEYGDIYIGFINEGLKKILEEDDYNLKVIKK